MLPKIKKIESVADMLAWAKAVNSGLSINEKCEAQDIYARSLRADLDKFFIASEGERKLVICSVNNVMAFDEVEHLLLKLAQHKVDKEMEDHLAIITERYNELHGKEYEFNRKVAEAEKAKADLEQTNRDLSAFVDRLEASRAALQKEILQLRQEMAENADKARRYDTIQEALRA
jgi:hypothetical protein